MERVLVFQHNPDSPLGVIEPELRDAGCTIHVVDAAEGCVLPGDAPAYDRLILLGGAMSANDDARYPHFPDLLRLVRDFTEARKPVLGVCLGGQLIARALGGRVVERAKGEFGFVPVAGNGATADDPLLAGIDLPVRVMQWHDDHFEPPPGAVHLLSSAVCPAQAFRAGRSWGFQCHFEVDEPILRRWAELRAELVGDPAIVEEVAAAGARHLAEARRFGTALARNWLALA